MLDPVIISLIGAALAGGAAFGGVKVAMNGTKQSVSEIKVALTDHIKEENLADIKTHERIATVETKVDVLIERVK